MVFRGYSIPQSRIKTPLFFFYNYVFYRSIGIFCNIYFKSILLPFHNYIFEIHRSEYFVILQINFKSKFQIITLHSLEISILIVSQNFFIFFIIILSQIGIFCNIYFKSIFNSKFQTITSHLQISILNCIQFIINFRDSQIGIFCNIYFKSFLNRNFKSLHYIFGDIYS